MSGPIAERTPRPRPHRYVVDEATPGACYRCRLPRANGVHDQAKVEVAERETAGWLAEEARRVGERQ